VHSVSFTGEGELNALVLDAIVQDSIGNAGVHQESHAVVLEDPRPYRGKNLIPSPVIDDHGIDAGALQQVTQH
jgi:hypothetical protein